MTNFTPSTNKTAGIMETAKHIGQTVIVLMKDGRQLSSTSPSDSLRHTGGVFRDALENGAVRGAVIVSTEGIYQYTAGEVAELAEHASYR